MSTKERRADHIQGHRAVFDKNKAKLLRIAKAQDLPCAICGREIDYKLKYPDPMSASADHIIPISKGGHPSDFDNLQITHLCCNISKSNKIVPKSGENDAKSGENQLKNISSTSKEVVSMRNLPQHFDWKNFRFKP